MENLRDGAMYKAVDPANTNRTYVETDVPIEAEAAE